MCHKRMLRYLTSRMRQSRKAVQYGLMLALIWTLVVGLKTVIGQFSSKAHSDHTVLYKDRTFNDVTLSPFTIRHRKEVTVKTKPGVSYSAIQRDRLDLISKTCANQSILDTAINIKMAQRNMLYSSKYNFSYCKTPKIGSTFWTQAFEIFEAGTNVSDTVFAKKRIDVHMESDIETKTMEDWFKDRRTPVILSTRSPFSRLYALFIDKSYLMLVPTLNKSIRRTLTRTRSRHYQEECTHVTFAEFLEYILIIIWTADKVDYHVAPVYSICTPCSLNISYIVKQESFADDVYGALQNFKVNTDEIDILMSALHQRRIDYTIPSIVKTAYERRPKTCLTPEAMAHRLWKSFQLQGYVSNEIGFPSQHFLNPRQYDDPDYVVWAFMAAIEANPMTSVESQQQRHAAIAQAYLNVSSKIIAGIHEVYGIDFRIFDYDLKPPTL